MHKYKLFKCICMLITAILIVNIFTTTYAITDTSNINNLNIYVSNCNVKFDFSSDGQYSYDYDESKFTITTTIKGSTTEITITPKNNDKTNKTPNTNQNNEQVFDIIKVYIPNESYNTVTVTNNKAGIGLPSFDSNINYTCTNGAANINLPKEYEKNLNFKAVSSAVSIGINEPSNFTMTLKRDSDSVASLPKHFPTYTFDSDYTVERGNGKSKINIDVEKCALTLSVNEKK